VPWPSYSNHYSICRSEPTSMSGEKRERATVPRHSVGDRQRG
jgi:hypothetical protein